MAKVTFTESGAKRIAAATLAYERGNRDSPPVTFRSVVGDDETVRLGKTTGEWQKDSLHSVAVHELGTPPFETDSGVSLTCVNKFLTIPANKWVIVAKAGNGYWYLIAGECS